MAIPRGNNEQTMTSVENQSSRGDEPAKVNYDQIADYLTDGYWEWDGGSRRAFDVAPGGTLTADITGLTAAGQQLARWALETWTNVTGIDFRFVESDANITFDDGEDGAYSSSVELGSQIISSFVNVSADWLDDFGSTIDSYGFQTYIHEIGHALGLGHPGPYNWITDYGVGNIFPGDSRQATVMSYFDQDENTYIDASLASVVTPMIADVIAIQNLYGVPTDINAGDTVYGYQSNLDGYLGQLFTLWTGERNDPEIYRGEAVTLTLYDTGGHDMLDLRTDTDDQRVDLRPEGISDVYGLVGNLLIARGTWIENFIAGSGNDKVIGNAVANRLAGGAGNDELWGSGGDDVLEGGAGADRLEGGLGADRLLGGAGMDTVSYSGSDGAVTVDLEAGIGKRGHAEGDVIIDIESVVGSKYGDVLQGDAGANRLSGGAGDDSLGGGAGDDSLGGGAGDDSLGGGTGDDFLGGGAGNDSLRGGAGADRLEGGLGADRLLGGAGMDTVSYSRSDGAVTVDLEAGIGKRGHAEGDVIIDIESVVGSKYGDVLQGDAGANRLSGGAGNDSLRGGAGNDSLGGGAGNDSLRGGAGNDSLQGGDGNDFLSGSADDDSLSGGDGFDQLLGGAGADRLDGGLGADTVLYTGSDEAVTVDLWDGTGKGGHAEGDVITDIENVVGSDYEDVLEGDPGANRLNGGGGNDRLLGRGGDDVLEGGAGADELSGGAGMDTVSYSGSDEAVTVDLEVGTGEGGHAEGDVITDIENVVGSEYRDVLQGDAGANRLEGGAGADELSGGAGMDTVSYSGSDEAVTVDLGDGTGEGGHAEGDVITDIENVVGSEYRDVLQGDAGANRLDGGAGVDTVSYSGSDEAVTVDLEAGTGKRGHAEGDVIVQVENVLGSGYGDVLRGDDSANQLSGGGGNDRLSGRGGDDVLEGGAGADRLSGGGGNDTVSYAESDWGVRVYLETGTGKGGHAEGDVIMDFENVLGSVHGDVLGGDDGANRLSGGGGNDRLSGRGGDDVLEGGAGADRLIGGAGVDTVSYAGSDRGVRVYLETGTGKGGHAEGDVIAQVESALGSGYGDVLGGNDRANQLSGGGGNDRLSGRGGDDVLEGGAGADRLIGGAGVDTVSYAGSDKAVIVYLETGTGKRGHAEGDVIAQVESVLGSDYGDVLGGDDGANQLSGGGGNDRLSGRGGDDVLEGGAGADRLLGGAGVDTVSYSGSDEAVRVDLEAGTGKRGHAEGDVITDIENVIGSEYGDLLIGDNNANRLSGGDGNDQLWGGDGNDELRGGAGNDFLDGGIGNDELSGGAGADRLFGGAGVDTVSYSGSDEAVTVDLQVDTGKGGHAEGDVIVDFSNVLGSGYGDVLRGDAWNNRLSGGSGNDRLSGRGANDVLEGGAGADRLNGGAGDDVFRFGFGHGDDIIIDFTDGDDLIDLSAFGLSNFDELVVSSDPDGVTIDLTAHGGGTILLEGFDIADLDAGDILLA